MANLEINRKPKDVNETFKQIESDSWSNLYLPAICAGVLMTVVLFLAIACSKKSDNGASQITPPTQPAVSNPAPATTAAAALPEPAKKVKKHRPTNATYVNGTYGVSFTYPRKYSLAAGNQKSSSPVQPSFLKPGAVEVASVDVPDDSYPDTDFSSALLNVSVNTTMSAEECGQFVPSSKDSDAAKPSTVKLGANEFVSAEQMNGEITHQSDVKYYHLFKNAACYEFALDVETSRKADEDLAQVDRMKVFQQLQKVLATARIKEVQLPGVEKAETTAASSQATSADSKTADVRSTDSKPADSMSGESKAVSTDAVKSEAPIASNQASDSKAEKAQVVTTEQK